MKATEFITEKWSQKYKSSINCSNPKGFSQRAHCAGKNKQDESINEAQQLSVQQLAQISDAALDSAYGYGRSSPGNTFGWQANLKSAAFAKQMIDRGVTDIEAISDAIHKGWNVTAQAFVKNSDQFDDSKTMAPEKLQAKIAQRQKLMTQQYAQLPEDEKEKDRVVARAMLQAITGKQGVAEAIPTIRGTPKAQPGADYTGEDLVRDTNALFTAGGFKLADKEVEPRVDNPKKINTTYYWRKKIKGLDQVQQLMIEIYNYAPKRTYWAINDWANDGARVTPDLAQKLWRQMEKTIKDSIDTAERENYWYSMTGNGKVPKDLEEEFDLIESNINYLAERNGVDAEVVWEDLESLTDDELYVFAATQPVMEDWQKANKKDKTDGMSQKAVNAYRREHPGSKLKTAVTTKPSKLKKGSKASKRRKSYCSRSRGQMKMHNISCAKTPDKAICKARRRWNC